MLIRLLARFVLGVAAPLALLAAGLTASFCRTPEGDLNSRFVLFLASGATAAVIGWTTATSWAGAARWFALAIIGQAAALQLIDAGVRIHYQHYRLPSEAWNDPYLRWQLLLVALQAAVVAIGLAVRSSEIAAWINGRRMLLLAVGMAASGALAAAVSRDPRYYVLEVSLATLLELVSAANILLAVWSISAGNLRLLSSWSDFLLGSREDTRPVSIDRFVLRAALAVVISSAALMAVVYQRHPHVADEVVYVYQARYFAAGQAVMPPPPSVRGFEIDLMEYLPRHWYSVTPPGWPAVLAVGVAVGVPWLVNPLLGGLNIVLSYLFLGELYSRRTARLIVLLLCLSPWQIFVSMSYMNHALMMTAELLAFWGIARARRSGLARWALLAGAGVGLGSLIRPLDALIVAVLAGLWAIGIGGRRLKFPVLVAFGLGTALVGAAALPYNWRLTGNPMSSPLMSYLDTRYGHNANAYGFGPNRGLGWATDAYPGHTLFEAIINAQLNGSCLNTDLFGWSTGSLAFIAICVLAGSLRRPDWLMIAVFAAVVLAYAPYWGTGGPDFGARYWYVVLIPCAVLSARGVEWLESRTGPRALAAVAALCALAAVNYIPWRSLDKYRHYLRMRPDIRTLAEDYHFGRSLVLVRGENFPDYSSAAIYNPINLHADAPVYAWDRSPEVRAELLRLYADRRVWIVEGPSITGSGYRVASAAISLAESR
jgi:hypothetical protein